MYAQVVNVLTTIKFTFIIKVMNTSLIYEKSCSVFGHSKIEITKELENNLISTFEMLITKENVKYFYFGGFGEFDDLCWQVVTKLKDKYPKIYRIFCLSDLRHQRKSKRPLWLNDEDYEEITYLDLSFDYWFTRIYFRNCEMIDRSDFVVFYVNHSERSGAYKALQYAIKKKRQIINIYTNLQIFNQKTALGTKT